MVGLAVGQSVSQLIIHPSDTKPVSQWVYQFVGRSERNPDTNTDKKRQKMKIQLISILTLDTLDQCVYSPHCFLYLS